MKRQELMEMSKMLDRLYAEEKRRAEILYPNMPNAQEIWAKLNSGRGGIVEVVQALGLHTEYDSHLQQFNAHCAAGMSEAASFCVSDFIRFCKDQFLENFYMFDLKK